jgi:hypothetical protein
MTNAKPSWDDLPAPPKVRKWKNGRVEVNGVPEYREPFELNQFGKPKANDPRNIEIALERLGIVLRYDSFINKNAIEGLRGFGPLVRDEAVTRIRVNTGLPPKRIDALMRAGMPHTPGPTSRAPATFNLKAIFAWFAEGNAEPPDPLMLARQRKVEAEAARIERANRKSDGELIPKDAARREIADGMAKLRHELLAIPTRLTSESAEVQSTVRIEIIAAINGMSFEATK